MLPKPHACREISAWRTIVNCSVKARPRRRRRRRHPPIPPVVAPPLSPSPIASPGRRPGHSPRTPARCWSLSGHPPPAGCRQAHCRTVRSTPLHTASCRPRSMSAARRWPLNRPQAAHAPPCAACRKRRRSQTFEYYTLHETAGLGALCKSQGASSYELHRILLIATSTLSNRIADLRAWA